MNDKDKLKVKIKIQEEMIKNEHMVFKIHNRMNKSMIGVGTMVLASSFVLLYDDKSISFIDVVCVATTVNLLLDSIRDYTKSKCDHRYKLSKLETELRHLKDSLNDTDE